MTKASKGSLEELHGVVADALITQLREKPTAQLLSVACKFLDNNNISVSPNASTEDVNKELFKIPVLTRKELEYEYVDASARRV